jgi:ribonuclease HI
MDPSPFPAESNFVCNIGFDGACRGNGKIQQLQSAVTVGSTTSSSTAIPKSAIGIFVNNSFQNPFSFGKIIDADKNNAAEIQSAVGATQTALDIVDAHQVKKFRFYGDSEHVISTIISGRIFMYERRAHRSTPCVILTNVPGIVAHPLTECPNGSAEVIGFPTEDTTSNGSLGRPTQMLRYDAPCANATKIFAVARIASERYAMRVLVVHVSAWDVVPLPTPIHRILATHKEPRLVFLCSWPLNAGKR